MPTYDPLTNTYTDNSGNSYSMPPQNVPIGTTYQYGSGIGSGGGTSGATGGNYGAPGVAPNPQDTQRHHGGSRSEGGTTTEQTIAPQPIDVRSRTSIQDIAGGKSLVEEKPYAINLGDKGVYTSDNKYYPPVIGQKKGWLPTGYQEGEQLSIDTENFYIAPKGSSLVSTQFGTAVKTGDQYTLIVPDTKAISDWASTQRSEMNEFAKTFSSLSSYYEKIGYKSQPQKQLKTNEKIVKTVGEKAGEVGEYPYTYGEQFGKVSESKFTKEYPELAGVKIGGNQRSIFFPQQTNLGKTYGRVMGGGFEILTAYSPAGYLPLAASAVSVGSKLYLAANAEQRKQAALGGLLVASYFIVPKSLRKPGVTRKTLKEGDTAILDTITTKTGDVFIVTKDLTKRDVTPLFIAEEKARRAIINDEDLIAGKYKIQRFEPIRYALEKPKSIINRIFFSPKQISSTVKKPIVTSVGDLAPLYSKDGQIVKNPLAKDLTELNPYVKTKREGRKPFTISTIEGKQVELSPEEVSKLSSTIKKQFVQANPVTSEKSKYSYFEVVTNKLFKSSPTKGVIISKPGTRRTIGSGVSQSTLIYETPIVEKALTKTDVIDISKPLRMTGDWESIAGKPKVVTYEELWNRARAKNLPIEEKEYLAELLSRSWGFYSPKASRTGGYFDNITNPKEIYVRGILLKKDKLETIKHETGHYIDFELDLMKDMSPQQLEDLYQEGLFSLKQKYKGYSDYLLKNVYPTKEQVMREAIAIRYENRAAIKPLKEVFGKTKPITITGQSTFIKEPIRIGDETGNILAKNPKTEVVENINQGSSQTSVLVTGSNVPNTIKQALAENLPKVQPSFPKPKETESIVTQVMREGARPASVTAQSIFSGQGTYERTESTPVFGLTSNKFPEQKLDQFGALSTKQLQIIKVVPQVKATEVSNIKSSQLQSVINIQDTSQVEEQSQLQNQFQLQKQAQLQKQKQFQDTVSSRGFTNIHIFGTPYIYPKKKKAEDSSSLFGKIQQAYKVIIYKRGKEVEIAKGLPKGLATKKGVQEVLSTLRASFKLKPSGTTTQEDIFYKMPQGFRLSKYDKNRFVQYKNLRFGSRPETKEAQFFRKVKKGKIKWF